MIHSQLPVSYTEKTVRDSRYLQILVGDKHVSYVRGFLGDDDGINWMRLTHDTWGEWEHVGLTVEEAVTNTLKKLGYVK
ncbi:MAG: hypothetical protein GWN93_06005 [Deltaproteobacteria bacterium]|nr:hypothetical protein [Deltaproteobacteria bacterium]